jgi:hypothetical protein
VSREAERLAKRRDGILSQIAGLNEIATNIARQAAQLDSETNGPSLSASARSLRTGTPSAPSAPSAPITPSTRSTPSTPATPRAASAKADEDEARTDTAAATDAAGTADAGTDTEQAKRAGAEQKASK